MVGPPSDANDQMAVFYLGGLFMKCLNCNTENKETYTKCKKCGQLLVKQKIKESVIEESSSYNWIPAAIVISFFIAAILVLKLFFKF